MQYVSAADSETIHGRDDGFRERADLLLYVQYVQARYAVFTHVAATSFHVHIASRAKRRISGSCQNDYVNVRTFPADVKGVAHLRGRSRGKSVAIPFPVDCNAGDAVVEIK